MLPRKRTALFAVLFLAACCVVCSCQAGGRHLRENFSIGQVSVRGKALQDSEAGASIVTRMEQHVFVEGLKEWPAHLLGKEVVVSGILKWDADTQRFAIERAHWQLAPEE